jgi:transcription antitermination factor NusG
VVAEALEKLDIPTFLPLVTEVHHWSDRKKSVTVPLFKSYLFVRIPASREMRSRVLATTGLVGFIGNEGVPIAIPDKEIDAVRSVLAQRVGCSPYPFLNTGARVRIVGGSLNGVEGTLIGRGPGAKLVISIELIQRSVAISVYDFNVIQIADSGGIAA